MSDKKEEVLYREEYPNQFESPKGHFISTFIVVTIWVIYEIFFSYEKDYVTTTFMVLMLCVFFPWLYRKTCAIIKVKQEGIQIYSWPLKRLKHNISLDNISTCITETRNELKDGTVYSTKKNIMEGFQYWGCPGVRIEYENGDEVFIGSNKKEELLEAIEKAIKLYSGS